MNRPLHAPLYAPLYALVLLLAGVTLAGCGSLDEQPPEAAILAINDVYRIEGVDDGARGGLARLRTMRAQLERTYPDLLLLHGGDLLGPSFLSRRYKGEQMIDVMNLLDGAPGFDDRMFVAFGNHEFDASSCAEPEVLRSRVAESKFSWLATNIDFAACHGAAPMLDDDERVKPEVVVESGGLRIGLFALLLPFSADEAEQQPEIRPEVQTAKDASRRLREQGADVVIALTHLPVDDDLGLLKALGADGPDLIVGGHDHVSMAVPAENPRVFKADADAVTATLLLIRLDAAGKPTIESHRALLDAGTGKDPQVQQTVDAWLKRHATEFCSEAAEASGCLDRVVGRTRTVIEAEELKNRSRETGIGDWIADRMADARPEADVALLNSGTLRLNHDLPADSVLYRRHVEELFGFKSPLLVVRATGAQLWAAAENSLRHRGEGGWAHVSGLALAVGADGQLSGLKVRRADGKTEKVTKESTKRYRVVLSGFVACGGDGYDFGVDLTQFGGDPRQCWSGIKDVVDKEGPQKELSTVVLEAIDAAGETGIAPEKDGRICEPGQADCLIERW